MSDIEFALPDDPDNDCDIKGIKITSIVRLGNEFIITGSGGSGHWIDQDGLAEVDHVEDFELTAGIMNEVSAELIHERVTEWMQTGTELHVVLCPGKYTSIIDHEREVLLPLPRT